MARFRPTTKERLNRAKKIRRSPVWKYNAEKKKWERIMERVIDFQQKKEDAEYEA